MLFQYVLLLLFSITLGQTNQNQIQPCSAKDKEFSKCLERVLTKVIPLLVKGIPKLGVFPIDPLHIDLLDLSNAPGKTLNVRHKFHDVDIMGLGSAEIRKIRADPKKYEIDVDAVIKKPFIMTGKYESVGKVLSLPIRGDGPFNITLNNLKAILKMKGHQVMKNGKRHLTVDVVKFPFQVDKMIVNFQDLFKGNKEISQTLNNVINENWEPILDDMRDSFEQAIGYAFQQIANRVLNKVPITDLIKDI